jgi:branched-chain amino acid transport system permease protein
LTYKALKKYFLFFLIIFSLSIPIFVCDPYFLHIINITLLFAISTYALNIMTGLTGQLNIAHAGFLGIGAYVSAILATKFSLSFWFSLPTAAFVTGVCGLLIGWPALRVRGIYFSLTTLAFGEAIFIVFDNWIPVTGGPMGIVGIPSPSSINISSMISINFNDKDIFYYIILLFLALSIYINRELLNSRLGRAMLAIRENEDLAQSIGISIAQTKVIAFVLSTILCGISGSLFAHYFRFISPVSFTLGEMFRILTMLIVGGMGTLSGPFVGTFIIIVLPEMLRSVEAFQWVAYGLILMLFIAFIPEGIIGFINRKLSEYQMSSDDK